MIKIRIRDADNEIDIQFPISESALSAKLTGIRIAEDSTSPPFAFVSEVYWPKEFSMLTGRTVNLDELNYLGKRMAGFDRLEHEQFLIGVSKLDRPVEKDLINLTFNLSRFTLCQDVSSYGKIGRAYVLNTEGAVPAHDEDDPKYNMRRVYAYLLYRRGLDRDVVDAFTHRKMIYESAHYHNAVFVGFDRDGVPRHANMRGTGSESTFKGNAEGSLPEYSFHWTGRSSCLYLFEAPIDMLSYLSMHKSNWQQHSYAAACSVSDRVLFKMLKDNPHISEVFLCLDNDEPGQVAANRISDKLFIQGISAKILIPECKDWNEDLLFRCQTESEEEEPCQALQL